jgi:hypothetical protein
VISKSVAIGLGYGGNRPGQRQDLWKYLDASFPHRKFNQVLRPESHFHITAQCYILGQWLPKTAAFDAVFDAVAPRRAHDRVPSILALGLFLPVSDFTQPETGSPTVGDRETWASLPVLFWRVSCRFLPGVIPRLRHPAMILATFIDLLLCI